MGETEENAQDTLPAGGQSSGVKEGTTSTQTPETYTKGQVQKFVSDALAEQGRKHKSELDPIVKERDGLKSQIQNNTTDLEDNKNEMEKLQAKIDDLTSDDPDRFNAIKELKAAREERKQLQAERRTKETEWATNAERIKKAESLEAEVLILGIAEDYEGAGAEKLSSICSTLNATSEEQIRKVADTLWTKKTVELPETSPAVYSGMTEGGGTSFTRQQIASMSTEDYIKLRPQIEAAQKAGKIK